MTWRSSSLSSAPAGDKSRLQILLCRRIPVHGSKDQAAGHKGRAAPGVEAERDVEIRPAPFPGDHQSGAPDPLVAVMTSHPPPGAKQ